MPPSATDAKPHIQTPLFVVSRWVELLRRAIVLVLFVVAATAASGYGRPLQIGAQEFASDRVQREIAVDEETGTR